MLAARLTVLPATPVRSWIVVPPEPPKINVLPAAARFTLADDIEPDRRRSRRAAIDVQRAGEGVGAAQGNCPAAVLVQIAGAGDRRAEMGGVRGAEGQRVGAEGHRASGGGKIADRLVAAVRDVERAGADDVDAARRRGSDPPAPIATVPAAIVVVPV